MSPLSVVKECSQGTLVLIMQSCTLRDCKHTAFEILSSWNSPTAH